MAILTYQQDMTVAIAGQIADDGEHDVRSYINAEATTELAFGTAVVQGDLEKDGLSPASGTDVVVGILAHSHDYAAEDLGTLGVKAGRQLNVMNRGRLWVVVGGDVAIGDRGHVSFDATEGGAAGRILASGTINKTLGTEAQIVFRTAATGAGSLALADVDFVNLQGASPTVSY